MRTPIEKGFCSMRSPSSKSSSNVSRAECPQASTMRRAGISLELSGSRVGSGVPVPQSNRSPRVSRTSAAATAPSSKRMPSSCAWKRTSPPASSI